MRSRVRAARRPRIARRPVRAAFNPKGYKSSGLTLDELIEIVDLREASMDKFNDLVERNLDYIWGMTDGIEDEDQRMEAQGEVESRMYDAWVASAERVVREILPEIGLELNIKKARNKQNTYSIVPKKSWNDAGAHLVELINGVGYFHFRNLKELMASGPYTARDAVLSHLGYLRDYGAVYGATSMEREFESNLKSALRYL